MSNRLIITATPNLYLAASKDVGVRIDGDYDANFVKASNNFFKLMRLTPPENDFYSYAAMATAISKLAGNENVTISKLCEEDLNRCRNGVYVIKDWDIVRVKYDDPSRTPSASVSDWFAKLAGVNNIFYQARHN